MSTTARPVTQLALTDVKRATPGLADPGPARMIGSMSRSAPSAHRMANDKVIVRAGERRTIRACLALVRARTSESPWVVAAGAGKNSLAWVSASS